MSFYAWRVLRTGQAFTDDADWAGDVTTTPPTTGIGDIPQFVPHGDQKHTEVEFFVIPYIASSGLEVSHTGDTFSFEPVFIHDTDEPNRPVGSAIRDTRIVSTHLTAALSLYKTHYRFECDGARKFTIRMHTFSATPTNATAWELWYRPVVS